MGQRFQRPDDNAGGVYGDELDQIDARHDRARAVASGHAVVGVEGVANALIEQPPPHTIFQS